MNTAFADTHFYIALLDDQDGYHEEVQEFLRGFEGLMITTRWILAKVANFFCSQPERVQAVILLQRLGTDPGTVIKGPSDELYEQGLELYSARPDKEWSLTDCISFVVMSQEKVTEALTGDRHFAQAGFTPLFSL